VLGKTEILGGPLYRPGPDQQQKDYQWPAALMPSRYVPRDIALECKCDRPSYVQTHPDTDPRIRAARRIESAVARRNQRPEGIGSPQLEVAARKRGAQPKRNGMPQRGLAILRNFGGWIAGADVAVKLGRGATSKEVAGAFGRMRTAGEILARDAVGMPHGSKEYAVRGTPDDAPVYQGVARVLAPSLTRSLAEIWTRRPGEWLSSAELLDEIRREFPTAKRADVTGRLTWYIRTGKADRRRVSRASGTIVQYTWLSTEARNG
jgi:hypothetical protein